MNGYFHPIPKQATQSRRRNGAKECEIQAAVNELLGLRGADYFRIPDAVYRAFKTGIMPSPGVRMGVLEELRGLPDNAIHIPLFEYDAVRYCLSPLVELKREKGSMHGEQKRMGRRLGYNVCRDVSEVDVILTKARELVVLLQEFIKERK